MSTRYLVIAVILLAATFSCAQTPVGIFENHADVGTVLHPGSATFDGATGIYTLTGSGENMWLTADAFQFAWKKMSGDVELTADISFANSTGNPHKKAVLMIRQSLDADSVYADIAVHANGLGAIQFREEKGGATSEIQSAALKPRENWRVNTALPSYRVRIVRHGNYVEMFTLAGESVSYDGESIRIPLAGDFYVGLGVCSHDKDVTEEARFTRVELRTSAVPSASPVLYSALETVPISSGFRQVVYMAQGRFEAPNWSRDGSYLLFNRSGHLEKLPINGDRPEALNTGSMDHLNNDHGISPDANLLAISDNSQETKSADGKISHDSLIYLVPINGGTPKRITQNAPSYWHGWSPDGKTLAFVGQRNGEFDIYTIKVTGGEETRITTAKGLDDGPEYSPDGQYIYFNSERTGHMQIWRMRPDGSDQGQVFSDDYNNWFPHISPDGKWMVFLTYEKDVTGHPENKDVMLRLMSLEDKKITVLAKLFGGQGTINVPSWSPDSKQIAFVSYQFIPPEDAQKQEK
jgi:TolB protein